MSNNNRVCVDRPKEYRLTIQNLVTDGERDMAYFNVDTDAPFLLRGWKVEYNQDWPGDGGLAVRIFDNEGYSPSDSLVSVNFLPNCYAMANAGFTGLINQAGPGQVPALFNPQLHIPAGGRIGLQVKADSNWTGNGGLLKIVFIGVKRFQ